MTRSLLAGAVLPASVSAPRAARHSQSRPEKAMVRDLLKDLETRAAVTDRNIGIFVRPRDYAAAERFWASDYIQHSAHMELVSRCSAQPFRLEKAGDAFSILTTGSIPGNLGLE